MESVKKQEPFQLTLSKKEEKLRRRKKIIAGIKTNKTFTKLRRGLWKV